MINSATSNRADISGQLDEISKATCLKIEEKSAGFRGVPYAIAHQSIIRWRKRIRCCFNELTMGSANREVDGRDEISLELFGSHRVVTTYVYCVAYFCPSNKECCELVFSGKTAAWVLSHARHRPYSSKVMNENNNFPLDSLISVGVVRQTY